jgi:hypothetical protein
VLDHTDIERVSTNDDIAYENHVCELLMYWALCCNKFRLAFLFWRRSKQTVFNALAASALLHGMAHHNDLRAAYLVDSRNKFEHNSGKFNELAVGVLKECNEIDQVKTKNLVLARSKRFPKKTALDVCISVYVFEVSVSELFCCFLAAGEPGRELRLSVAASDSEHSRLGVVRWTGSKHADNLCLFGGLFLKIE